MPHLWSALEHVANNPSQPQNRHTRMGVHMHNVLYLWSRLEMGCTASTPYGKSHEKAGTFSSQTFTWLARPQGGQHAARCLTAGLGAAWGCLSFGQPDCKHPVASPRPALSACLKSPPLAFIPAEEDWGIYIVVFVLAWNIWFVYHDHTILSRFKCIYVYTACDFHL